MEPRTDKDAETGSIKPGDLFERYQILKLLGRGGHASVYHARHEFIDREVAIKISHRSVTREVFRRFQAEARLTHKLRHANIVEVLDADVASTGHLYIVMELLRGQTFQDARQRFGKFTIPEALLLCAQVAEGMEQAHRVGAIHRDLKPPNLFITDNNRVKVLDFGIAKVADGDASTTHRNIVHGTLRYMSPEQLMGEVLTPRSDIYALGVILFELLTGQHPHIGENALLTEAELACAIALRAASSLSEVDPNIPSYVVEAVQRALYTQAAQRFGSMMECAATLLACYDRYVREFGQSDQVRALWQPVSEDSAVIRSAAPSTQEHVATAVVPIVPPQSSRPTIRVVAASPKQPDDEPQVTAPARGGSSPQRRILTIRRMATVAVSIGSVIGVGTMLAQLGRRPPETEPPAADSASGRAEPPQKPIEIAQPAARLSAEVNAVESTTIASAVPATATSSRPLLRRAPAPQPPQRQTTAMPSGRPQSAAQSAEDRLQWFQEDRRSTR